MESTPASINVPPQLLRDVELAAAAARERVLDTHLHFLLEFVERARGDLAPPRVLSIYSRLHRLETADSSLLGHRMLVALGRQTTAGPPPVAPPAEDAPELPWAGPRSMVGRLRKRLRGRVNAELRRWVEVQTGRAEIAVLEVHVEHALRFIDLLAPTASDSYAEAVELYARLLNVPPAKLETLYLMTLAHVGKLLSEPASTGDPAAAPAKNVLRILENRAG